MESRDIKELLELLREYIIKQDGTFIGMCAEIIEMNKRGFITEGERFLLKRYLTKNKPVSTRNVYWWPAGFKTPRINWLDEEIIKLERREQSKITRLKRYIKTYLIYKK